MTQAKPIEATEELRQRILDKVETGDGCWEWQGARTTLGYGRLWIGGAKGRRLFAHRASYVVFVGPVPPGLVLDHLCRNTCCINPAHLEPVTARENLVRGESPMAKALRTGICKRGHDRDQADRHGHCRRCQADKRKEYLKQREAADPTLREARLEQAREYNRSYRANLRSA